MEDNFAIQLFEGKKVRIVWDEEQEKYFLGLPQILICGKIIMDCRFRRRANKRDRKSVDRR
ncbi:MAG: hypothetical protein MR794_06855 [Bacteroidales bacterium]|nr:hypothetical protein [Bacteroidales bacterium]